MGAIDWLNAVTGFAPPRLEVGERGLRWWPACGSTHQRLENDGTGTAKRAPSERGPMEARAEDIFPEAVIL